MELPPPGLPVSLPRRMLVGLVTTAALLAAAAGDTSELSKAQESGVSTRLEPPHFNTPPPEPKSYADLPSGPCVAPGAASEVRGGLCAEARRTGKIAVVDFFGLTPAQADELDTNLEATIWAASGGFIANEVTVIPASPRARAAFQRELGQQTCLDKTEGWPAVIADQKMHRQLKEFDWVVGLSDVPFCELETSGTVGITELAKRRHTQVDMGVREGRANYEADVPKQLRYVANIAAHEIFHLHMVLGHAGTVEDEQWKPRLNIPSPQITARETPRGIPLRDIVTDSEAVYHEYGDQYSVMGVALARRWQQLHPTGPQLELLLEKGFAGKEQRPFTLRRPIGPESTTFTGEHIAREGYGVVPLTTPVTLVNSDETIHLKPGDNIPTVSFDELAIVPVKNRASFSAGLMLVDTRSTYNTALLGFVEADASGNGTYRLDLGDQVIEVALQVRWGRNELRVRRVA